MNNVLLIGSGGREHAIAWSIYNDNNIENLYCAPGHYFCDFCASFAMSRTRDRGLPDIRSPALFCLENPASDPQPRPDGSLVETTHSYTGRSRK